MKVLLLLSLAVVVLAAPEKYHVKIYKDYETEPLTTLEGIVDCMVYELSCTPVRDAYRAAYPEVMQNVCQYCTEEQKRAAYHFYNRISRDLETKYWALRNKFDPDHKYYDNFYRALEHSVQNENKL